MPMTRQQKRLSETGLDVAPYEDSPERLDALDLLHDCQAADEEEEDDEMMVEDCTGSEQDMDDSDADTVRSDDSRSEGELEDVRQEMRELERTVNLHNIFRLVDRLGEGTFSSVYKAVDLHHPLYDNSEWHPTDAHHQPTPDPSSVRDGRRKKAKVYVALKRIYVTSSPQRIQNELDILGKLRGYPNVAYLISAFRHEDQVIAVMPYEKHQDFRDYYRTASMSLIRNYFWCLLSGLASAHHKNVIHRDIKPANFLFNTETGYGTVCDFGLAQIFDPFEWRGHCRHSLPMPKLPNMMHGVLMARPASSWNQVCDAKAEWNKKHPGEEVLDLEENSSLMEDLEEKYLDETNDFWDVYQSPKKPKAGQRIGYLKPEHERRPGARANRAGTRGFRAPEVLFKCPDQTVSIDIWSVGITLLCFLTRRFPFFNSNDDTEALMEIACIFGKRKMEECGALHNRVFITNVPTVDVPFRKNLHELVRSLNPSLVRKERPPHTASDDFSWYEKTDLFQAVDLMKQLLLLDCTRRITALEALQHPFFQEPFKPPQPPTSRS